MSSPHRSIAQHLLESEIRQRSRLIDNNTDFYQLKLTRLEQDFALVQEQLNFARIRLRTAEDFQIKYELLTKQNSSLLQENNKLVKELGVRKMDYDHVVIELENLDLTRADFQRLIITKDDEILSLLDRIKQFQHQAQTLAIRASRMHDGDVNTLKKANQQLQGVIDEFQYTSNARTQQYSDEISKLNGIVQNLEDELKRQSQRHSDQIRKLNQQFERKQQLNEQKLLQQRQKFHQFQQQLQQKIDREKRERSQGVGDQQIGFLTQQIKGLTNLLKDKQEQLQEVFQQKQSNLRVWDGQREDLRNHIKLLEQKLYQRQRQNQLQLLNLTERLTKLHAQQVATFKKNQQELVQALNLLKPDDLLKDKDNQIILLKQKIQNDINLHDKDKQQILKGIDTLKDRIRQHNAHADTQHKIMTSLNLNIEQQRTAKQTDYENNLTFLDQQLKRANLTIEQKNLEIKKLLNELNDLKVDSEKDRKEMLNKAEGERKHLNQKIDRLLEEKQATEQELKRKEKQVKVKDRELQEQISKAAAERKAYERLQQQLHIDCKRMADELKLIERVVRDERQKNVTSVTDLNTLRREKLGDLDRQKQQFELLYRGKLDQLKDSLNLQIDKLRVERDRLQTELIDCRLQLTESQQDLRKVSSLVAQQSTISKQKLVQYQKKMATLNHQINLTQNLYNSFIDAKSRLKQSRAQNQS